MFEKDLLKLGNPYLYDLNKHYEEWIQSYDKGPKMIINTNNMIIANEEGHSPLDLGDTPKIINKIKQYLR